MAIEAGRSQLIDCQGRQVIRRSPCINQLGDAIEVFPPRFGRVCVLGYELAEEAQVNIVCGMQRGMAAIKNNVSVKFQEAKLLRGEDSTTK